LIHSVFVDIHIKVLHYYMSYFKSTNIEVKLVTYSKSFCPYIRTLRYFNSALLGTSYWVFKNAAEARKKTKFRVWQKEFLPNAHLKGGNTSGQSRGFAVTILVLLLS